MIENKNSSVFKIGEPWRKSFPRTYCWMPLASRQALKVVVIIVVSLSSEVALPQESLQGTQPFQLLEEEVVSIAVRHEQPISEAPSNVYVITAEEIQQSGATDIPAVLRRIPGMEIIRMSGAQIDVSMRGNNQPNANRLLILVDGRSVYHDINGTNTILWKSLPITLPEIQRVEVLKGPASAVYGFNAFDGVINIITKSPREMDGLTAQFGAGEFGTITSSGVYAGQRGDLGYRFSIGRDQNQQWRNRDALAFRAHKFNAQMEYELKDDSKVIASGGLVNVNRFDGTIEESSANSLTVNDGYARLAYEHKDFFLRTFWRRAEFDVNLMPNPILSGLLTVTDPTGTTTLQSIKTNTYDVEGQHSLHFTENHQLTYGINFRHNTVESNVITTFSTEDRLGMYFQHEWKLLEQITTVAGVRLDLHSEINPTYSPRLALIFKPAKDHTFRVAGSLAYRPPTLFETNFSAISTTPFTAGLGGTSVIGNPNLDPERIISYELGYQGWFFKHRVRARGDLFFNHISDLINNRAISSTPPLVASFVNDQGEADIYGGEVGIEFLAASWLTVFVNYAYQDFHQEFTDTAERGGPQHKVNVGVMGEWDNGLRGEVTFHHVGSATYPLPGTFALFESPPVGPPLITPGSSPDPRVDSYNLVNIRGGYLFWNKQAEVAFAVYNALNDRHREHPLGDILTSRVMGWITLNWF